MTTKSKKFYHQFKFKQNDFLFFGRESVGVPNEIHEKIKNKLKVPLSGKARSLNVAITVAVVASEALKQNNFFK
jgi:tRNA (cytidine/uridine-2'-O-)-methyltransferase